jgi:hypothetical protein
MPFLRYARAKVVKPHCSGTRWKRVRTASTAAPSENLIAQANEILGEEFNPQNYLLTHATIVCSVETSELAGVKMGSVMDPMTGKRVNRKWADYRISPECDQFINNNNDAWARDVLMKSYRTFVGAHNFVEHVQVEEQSKGRIIDAVARDIGPSVYVDILIATSRKNAALVQDIEAGKMGTLSMGCSVTETICTKCGNVAADETEMCQHIKYEKGNYFHDDRGAKHRIAELCGHPTIDPNGGVQFIEASWVATPAFGGAVMRNILAPNKAVAEKAAQVLSTPPAAWQEGGVEKAARIVQVPAVVAEGEFDFGDTDEGGGDEGGGDEGGEGAMPTAPEKPEAEKPDQLQKLEDDLYTEMAKRVKDRMKRDLAGPIPSPGEPAHSTGEDVIKQARWKSDVDSLIRNASSDAGFIDGLAKVNQEMGIQIGRDLYVASLRLGATDRYASLAGYLTGCERALGRKPNHGEATHMVRLGKLLSKWNHSNPSRPRE